MIFAYIEYFLLIVNKILYIEKIYGYHNHHSDDQYVVQILTTIDQ